jgi:hypothetical protein
MIPILFLVVLNLGMGATLENSQIDGCTNATYINSGGLSYGLQVESNCQPGAPLAPSVQADWPQELNLTFGAPTTGEIKSGDNWFYVDSAVRPDLDVPATLHFINHGFVTEPDVLRNGVACTDCNVSFTPQEVTVDVTGFSNYSLTSKQDFIVYSDPQPELKDKTYQTIDLGNSHRNESDFTCVVQVFGRNNETQWVLVQTNPERQVQGKLLGNPDSNQPESLGYFPVKNGLANTYFRGGELPGYSDFTIVTQCASPTQLLVYEEPVSTRYSPAGRSLVARGVWLTDGNNGAYLVAMIVGGLIVAWLAVVVWRSVF